MSISGRSVLTLSSSLQLPVDAVTQTFAILGKRGSGKTTTATVLTEELLAAGQPVVVIDPLDVTWGLRSSRDGKQAGYPITVLGGDHSDLPLDATAGAVLAEFVVEMHAPVILSLRHFSLGDQRRFVTDFAERLYTLKGKQTHRTALHLVIDEVDEFAHQRIPAGHERLFGAIDRLVRRGRSAGIGVTMISQRPAVIHKDILSQAEVLICHQTISPQDRKALEAWIEAHDAHGQRADFMATLAGLQRGEAWVWSPGWLDVFQRVTIRDRRTFDSSSTPKAGELPAAPKQLARVDLAQLEQRMAATIEKAKADDPRELRRQIADLTKQLALATAHAHSKDPQPVLTDTDRVHVNELARAISETAVAMHQELELTSARLRSVLEQCCGTYVDKVLDVTQKAEAALSDQLKRPRIAAVLDKLSQITPPTTTATVPRSPLAGRVAPASAQATSSRPDRQVSSVARDPSIGKSGLARMLVALAQRTHGLTRGQLGLRARVSAKGGSFDTYLSKARVNGWVTTTGERIVITAAGLEALGTYEPLPEGQALLQHYLSSFGQSGAARMLAALADAYPHALTRAELGDRARVSAAGGSFDTYLSKLRTLELVEGTRELRASEELFS